MVADPFTHDATAMAEMVAAGDVTPAELVDDAIVRAEKIDPEINAVVHPLFDQARARAAAADALPDGPFRGVPFLVKDLGCFSAGDPYHAGTTFLKDAGYVADHSTYLAEKFEAAGLVSFGRTNTPELGTTVTAESDAYGATRNPWDVTRSAGGSSGGSAAAVAAGIVPMAHANDGGGSIRIPASECGIVGLKPSRGRVTHGPDLGEDWAGATIDGVVSRTVRDTAGALDAISAPVPGDPYFAPRPDRPFTDAVGADPGRLRIGLMAELDEAEVHPDCVAAVDSAGRLLEGLGHDVSTSRPEAMDDQEFPQHFVSVLSVAMAADLQRWGEVLGKPVDLDQLEPRNAGFAELGRAIDGPSYLASIRWIHRFTRRMAQWWSDHDILVTPTIAAPPPPLGWLIDPDLGVVRTQELIPFTPPFNVTGQPAVSLPLHWNDDGLPIGVQLVASYAREDLLIALASQLEEASPWAGRMPPVHA